MYAEHSFSILYNNSFHHIISIKISTFVLFLRIATYSEVASTAAHLVSDWPGELSDIRSSERTPGAYKNQKKAPQRELFNQPLNTT